jgi:hypothetical protein
MPTDEDLDIVRAAQGMFSAPLESERGLHVGK